MTPIDEDVFFGELVRLGIGFDPHYPNARSLTFAEGRGPTRFWVLPSHPGQWPHFVDAICTNIDSWTEGFLWPRSGNWLAEDRLSSLFERMMFVVQRGVAIPDGWHGAIRITEDEIDTAIAVACSYMTHGWNVDADLYFIPTHGKQIVQTDHHDVVHVECRETGRITRLVEQMTEAGYPLPTEPPDWTFKWPDWMPYPGQERP